MIQSGSGFGVLQCAWSSQVCSFAQPCRSAIAGIRVCGFCDEERGGACDGATEAFALVGKTFGDGVGGEGTGGGGDENEDGGGVWQWRRSGGT